MVAIAHTRLRAWTLAPWPVKVHSKVCIRSTNLHRIIRRVSCLVDSATYAQVDKLPGYSWRRSHLRPLADMIEPRSCRLLAYEVGTSVQLELCSSTTKQRYGHCVIKRYLPCVRGVYTLDSRHLCEGSTDRSHNDDLTICIGQVRHKLLVLPHFS